ncbi:type I-U CRISPR-associated protein Cas5/Cas6 [Nonomuraea longispora]|uniref:Type I-U CRISPR-associated protein Cas5/Cas6 n=1 Tax=Nonomuraea longispora TaxID=1848320 RepID=A0A4R4MPW2_9ACTN|nr:type I-U CRISPR-associated protein Csb2 [Nonomuraea longispora]TDB97083.1 type I-U CRISPR-associated protein Cas5/Cas6 [Nonomuraea longispora]
MPYAIIAEPPLGTYRGHTGDGEVDTVPSPARLAAALLCAAAQGPRAVQDGGVLRPCEVDLAALRWLEAHPPDGIRVPELHVNRPEGLAYRIRLLEKRPTGRVFSRTPQRLSSVAVNGGYAWTWQVGPPAALREAIEALCAEVSHLGMAETPVRMWVGTAEPTHDLVADADWWDISASDLDLEVAAPGRAEALVAAYQDDNGAVPSAAKDRLVTNESHVRPTRITAALSPARYASRRPVPAAVPWNTALLAEVGTPLTGEADRVRWAVTMHKALIKTIGYGAPPVLTGKYAAGVERPANRCAIQALTCAEAALCGISGAQAVFALLLPADIDGADYQVIKGAWETLTEVRPGRRLTLSRHRETRADQFWNAPEEGYVRLWRTVPAAVPETRGQGRNWTLTDAVRLSVGLVLRDQLGISPGKGGAWYRQVADAVRQRGLGVRDAIPVRDGDVSRFVHKIPDGLPLRPYRALIDLANLAPARGLLAIGQARHLGNGLLIPDDVPAGEVAA